jgi:hypothetical protein
VGNADSQPPVARAPVAPGRPRRAGRVALALAAVALVLAVGGAFSFRRFVRRTRDDPGFTYRDPATLEKVMQQAGAAEQRGDRPRAIVAYRFVVAVGAGGDSTIARYVAAARAGLERLAR